MELIKLRNISKSLMTNPYSFCAKTKKLRKSFLKYHFQLMRVKILQLLGLMGQEKPVFLKL